MFFSQLRFVLVITEVSMIVFLVSFCLWGWAFFSGSENVSDGRYPPVSQKTCNPGSVMTKLRKKSTPISRSTPPDRSSAGNAKKISALSSNRRMSSGVLRKVNHENWDVQIDVSNAPFKTMAEQGETVLERSKKDTSRFLKSDMKRALLDKNPDDKMHKFGGSKVGSHVVPYSEESQDSVPVYNITKDLHKNEKESEDLSLIRNQLLQIEKQQSSLLDLLQVCSQCLHHVPSNTFNLFCSTYGSTSLQRVFVG